MSEWKNDELTEVLSEVARRTSVDPEFRKLALTEPKKAISQLSTKSLPEDLDIVFVDNSGQTKFYPLPDPVEGMEELTDQELELISGGVAEQPAEASDWYVTANATTGPTGPGAAGAGAWHR